MADDDEFGLGEETVGGDGRSVLKTDNKKKADDHIPSDVEGVARTQLKSFIERIERLTEEKQTVADDIKDVYGEAKGSGFDTKIMRKIIAIRKQDRDERMEQEAILETYMMALGML